MKSFWYTARQAATHLNQLTGQPVLPEEITEILSAEELAGSICGRPLMQGKQYGPMAIRAAHAKLLPQRQRYLTEEIHQHMPPVVVSHYSKGGSGKTSGIVNAGIALAQKGFRVLLIDADPQASATVLCDVDVDDESLLTLHDLTFGRNGRHVPMSEAIIPTLQNGVLDLVPADALLARFDAEAHQVRGGRDKLFEKVLYKNAEFVKGYDIVLVDTNPSTSSPLNFVLAYRADVLLMSIPMDAISMKSRKMMKSLFIELEQAEAPVKQVLVLANAFAGTTMHGKRSLEDLVREDNQALMRTVIPFSTAVARQGWAKKDGGGLSVIEREPASPVAKRLVRFALELAEYAVWMPREMGVLTFESEDDLAVIEAMVQEDTGE